jgi:hypothetical protein
LRTGRAAQTLVDLISQKLGGLFEQVDGNEAIGQAADHLVAERADRHQIGLQILLLDSDEFVADGGADRFQVERLLGIEKEPRRAPTPEGDRGDGLLERKFDAQHRFAPLDPHQTGRAWRRAFLILNLRLRRGGRIGRKLCGRRRRLGAGRLKLDRGFRHCLFDDRLRRRGGLGSGRALRRRTVRKCASISRCARSSSPAWCEDITSENTTPSPRSPKRVSLMAGGAC